MSTIVIAIALWLSANTIPNSGLPTDGTLSNGCAIHFVKRGQIAPNETGYVLSADVTCNSQTARFIIQKTYAELPDNKQEGIHHIAARTVDSLSIERNDPRE